MSSGTETDNIPAETDNTNAESDDIREGGVDALLPDPGDADDEDDEGDFFDDAAPDLYWGE